MKTLKKFTTYIKRLEDLLHDAEENYYQLKERHNNMRVDYDKQISNLKLKLTEYDEKYSALFEKYIKLADRYIALQEERIKGDD